MMQGSNFLYLVDLLKNDKRERNKGFRIYKKLNTGYGPPNCKQRKEMGI